MTIYVYNGMEVELTGRIAERKKMRKSSRRNKDDAATVETLIEIKSVNEDLDYKSWVKKEDLYEVIDNGD